MLRIRAVVESDVDDPDPTNDRDSATNSPRPQADVQIIKQAPAQVTAGTAITYELTVINAGPSTAMDVTVTDELPAGTVFSDAVTPVGSCDHQEGTVSCALGDIDPNTQVTITITANRRRERRHHIPDQHRCSRQFYSRPRP